MGFGCYTLFIHPPSTGVRSQGPQPKPRNPDSLSTAASILRDHDCNKNNNYLLFIFDSKCVATLQCCVLAMSDSVLGFQWQPDTRTAAPAAGLSGKECKEETSTTVETFTFFKLHLSPPLIKRWAFVSEAQPLCQKQPETASAGILLVFAVRTPPTSVLLNRWPSR